MIKVGDNLICKKSFVLGSSKTKYTNPFGCRNKFKINEVVIVREVSRLVYDYRILIQKKNPRCKVRWWFYRNKSTMPSLYIWDHFYTEKEIRHLKLQKINESRR